jgi:hypothetical protein
MDPRELGIEYREENCWKIPDRIGREYVATRRGWRSDYSLIGEAPQGVLSGDRISFSEMHISYRDWNHLAEFIAQEQVHHGLPGRSAGRYSYETGEANFWFRNADDARAHYDRLIERGFLQSPGPEIGRRPGI